MRKTASLASLSLGTADCQAACTKLVCLQQSPFYASVPLELSDTCHHVLLFTVVMSVFFPQRHLLLNQACAHGNMHTNVHTFSHTHRGMYPLTHTHICMHARTHTHTRTEAHTLPLTGTYTQRHTPSPTHTNTPRGIHPLTHRHANTPDTS